MKLFAILAITMVLPHAFADDPEVLRGAGDGLLRTTRCRLSYSSKNKSNWNECLVTAQDSYQQEAEERMRRVANENGKPAPNFGDEKTTQTVYALIKARSAEATYNLERQMAMDKLECKPFNYDYSECPDSEMKIAPKACKTLSRCLVQRDGNAILAKREGDNYAETFAKWKAELLAGAPAEAKGETAEPKVETLSDLSGKIVKQDASLPFGNLDEKTNSARFQNGDCDFKVAGMKKGFKDFSKMYTAKDLEWKVGPFTKVSQSDDQYADAIRICQAKTDPDEQKTCIGVVKAQGTYLGSGYVLLQASDGKVLVVSSKGDEEGIRTCLTQNGLVASETNQVTGKLGDAAKAAAGASR